MYVAPARDLQGSSQSLGRGTSETGGGIAIRWFLAGLALFGLAVLPALPLQATDPSPAASDPSQTPDRPSWDPDGDHVAVLTVDLQRDHRLDLSSDADLRVTEDARLDRRTRTVHLDGAVANVSLVIRIDDARGQRSVLVEGTSLSGELVNASDDGETEGPVSSQVLLTVMASPAMLIAEHWDLRERGDQTGFTCPKAVVSQSSADYSSASLRPTVTVPVGSSSDLVYARGNGCPGGQVHYAFPGLWTVSSGSGS